MPYASHRHSVTSQPRYRLPHAAQRQSGGPAADSRLAHAFRCARIARKTPEPGGPAATDDAHMPRQPCAIWPAAFAVLFVANLIPATGDPVSGHAAIRDGREGSKDDRNAIHGNTSHPMDLPSAGATSDGVAIAPIAPQRIKSDYSLSEYVDILAASSQPFLRTSETLLQAYTLVTGDPVQADTRRSFRDWTQALDAATGLIPAVGLTRLPGGIAGLVSDQIAGRAPGTDQVIGWVQSADARNFASQGIVRARPDSASFRHPPPPKAPAKPRGETQVRANLAPHGGLAHDAPRPGLSEVAAPAREPVDDIGPLIEGFDNPRPADLSIEVNAHERLATARIENENENLRGYAQSIPVDPLPPGPRKRLILFDGHHYIPGEAGYYRATRGQSADHWLVSAPRESESRALVPVHFDPATGEWCAEKPLRLCGGGCGPSREATPDSIGMDREKIASAVAHLYDEDIRDGIRFAFKDLSLLHLTRSNRPDLHMMRDNSIVDHRAALRASMKQINRKAPLIKQQEEASLITTVHYYWNHYAEAFCQENAEILFHYLIANHIPTDRIRMITIQPKNRPPHVLVLYTESEQLISMLEWSTPHPPRNFEPDGVGDMDFAREIYEARFTTVLLDPWSRARVTSFRHDVHAAALVDTLDAAFAEIGHRPGNPYRVSLTRPLGGRRGSAASLASAGSGGSGGSGSSSGVGSWTNAGGAAAGAGGESVDVPIVKV